MKSHHGNTEPEEDVRGHKFIGQDQAQVVIDYVNQPGRGLDDPVMELIEYTHQFEAGQLWMGQKIVELINRVTADLKLGVAESHAFSTLDGFTWKENLTSDPKYAALAEAFLSAVWLHKQGLLGRIRHCQKPDCRQWFFAVLPQQCFHSDVCRRESMSRDPKFKQRRKEYMQQLRKKAKRKKGR